MSLPRDTTIFSTVSYNAQISKVFRGKKIYYFSNIKNKDLLQPVNIINQTRILVIRSVPSFGPR